MTLEDGWVVCKEHPTLVHHESYECGFCRLGIESTKNTEEQMKYLVLRWREEAALIRKQQGYWTMSVAWKSKDEERMNCLEKCADELEAIL